MINNNQASLNGCATFKLDASTRNADRPIFCKTFLKKLTHFDPCVAK